MREEKKSLSDIHYTFKILERDDDKHGDILSEPKLKQDKLKRLNTEHNRIIANFLKLKSLINNFWVQITT